MALVARTGVWLTRATLPVPDGSLVSSVTGSTWPLTTDGLTQAIASGEMRMTAGSNMQLYSSMSNVVMGAQGQSDTLTITSNAVEVKGTLKIVGTLDAINTTELYVRDKVIRACEPYPTTVVAEIDLTDAGLALARGKYEKSIIWRIGAQQASVCNLTLMDTDADPSNVQAIPKWDMRGGMLRMMMPTRSNPSLSTYGGMLGYGFNLNLREELEVIKYWTNSSNASDNIADNPSYQRVACFGGGASFVDASIAGEESLLPQSTNWFV